MTTAPVTVAFQVTAPPEQLAAFARVCQVAEKLCGWEVNRTVKFQVNGDGDAGISFDFGDLDPGRCTMPTITGRSVVPAGEIGSRQR